MGFVIAGVCIMAIPVGLAWWASSRLRKEGESARAVVFWLTRSPTFYTGLFVVLMGASEPLGEAAFVVLVVTAIVMVVPVLLKLPRVIRDLPGAFRDIGDPAAWRGER